jgi:hypothetical protein
VVRKKKSEPAKRDATSEKLTFSSIRQGDVPHQRRGKHHDIVADLIRDLQQVGPGSALKVPRSAFGEAKLTNVRAALNRVAAREGLEIATSSDEEHFYVWVTNQPRTAKAKSSAR